jgi:transcriptional regulator with XRE-family HTH domain
MPPQGITNLRLNPDALNAWLEERWDGNKSELARAVGISPQYLADLLAGRKPGTGVLIRKLADTLRVNVRVLVVNPNDEAA